MPQDGGRSNDPAAANGLRLNVALMCERVLEETDGTLSVIRIADRLTIDLAGELPSGGEPIAGIPSVLLLMFKREADEASEHQILVTATSPSGREILMVEAPLAIAAGSGKGADLILRFRFLVTGAGIHWVNISADGRLLTRVPIDVVLRGGGDSGVRTER